MIGDVRDARRSGGNGGGSGFDATHARVSGGGDGRAEPFIVVLHATAMCFVVIVVVAAETVEYIAIASVASISGETAVRQRRRRRRRSE